MPTPEMNTFLLGAGALLLLLTPILLRRANPGERRRRKAYRRAMAYEVEFGSSRGSGIGWILVIVVAAIVLLSR